MQYENFLILDAEDRCQVHHEFNSEFDMLSFTLESGAKFRTAFFSEIYIFMRKNYPYCTLKFDVFQNSNPLPHRLRRPLDPPPNRIRTLVNNICTSFNRKMKIFENISSDLRAARSVGKMQNKLFNADPRV